MSAEVRHCEHEGCLDRDVVECNLNDDDNTVEYFCAAHCFEAGYCYLCGNFCAGIESFDFDSPRGLCDNCRDQVNDDGDRYDPDSDFGFDDPYEVAEPAPAPQKEKP